MGTHFRVKMAQLMRAAGGAAKAAASVAGVVAGSLVLKDSVEASADRIVPPNYPFSHKGFLGAFDAAAIRRGHQVYSNVCATCHSMNLLAYRNLVDACYTEEEVRAMCEDVEVVDGPDEEGEMFDRHAKLSDKIVAPYRNEMEARFS